MYLIASFFDSEQKSEKVKIAELRGLCKSLDIPAQMVHKERMHLTIEGSPYHQCLKVNALNNFCAYSEIVLQEFPLTPELDGGFGDFLKVIYGRN
jgi:hypothetical protein